jgi:hypothetical protein
LLLLSVKQVMRFGCKKQFEQRRVIEVIALEMAGAGSVRGCNSVLRKGGVLILMDYIKNMDIIKCKIVSILWKVAIVLAVGRANRAGSRVVGGVGRRMCRCAAGARPVRGVEN